MDYEERLRRAREEMKKRNIGLMYLQHGANLWYLAGFTRAEPELTDVNAYGDYVCGAYIGADGDFTVVAPRMLGSFYEKEARSKPWIGNVRLVDESERPKDVLVEVIKTFHLKGIGVSVDDRTWMQTGLLLQNALPNSKFSLASDIIAPMRMIKDKDEIVVMKKAGEITDKVYGEVQKFLKVGVTEHDVAHEINCQFAKHGVEHPSFMTGVTFSRPGIERVIGGPKGKSKVLEKGSAITFDFGAYYEGYCTDFGRTAFIGEPPAEYRKAYDVVVRAQAEAIKKMVSGKITAMELDHVARSIVEKAGYGDLFVHRLGHGIGVTVHEPPYLYKPDDTILLTSMTFTIEPSILLPRSYSSRVEDVVMVTEEGGLTLTNFHKELTVIE